MHLTENESFLTCTLGVDKGLFDKQLEVAKRALQFKCYDIKTKEGAVWNAQSFEGDNKAFEAAKRLGIAFLEQLGRARETREEVVEGVPDVVLPKRLSEQDVEKIITLDSSTVDPRIFGEGSFSISVGELAKLERTTRVVMCPMLPPRFYRELCRMTHDTANCEFFSILRSVPLHRLPDPSVRAVVAVTQEQRRRDAEQDLKKLSTTDHWDSYIAETAIHSSTRSISYLSSPQSASVAATVASFLRAVLASPSSYGFTSRRHATTTLSLSLTELCTSVCVSQEGYYFVDGTGSTMNQLAPKTPHPIVFLSSPGLDFCTNSTTRLEMPKYFEEIEGAGEECDLSCRWKGFKEGGEASLQKRVKNLYRVILSSARLQGVRNPSMLPMGLGVFLYNVNKADHDGVREAYFRSQYELLTEEDWGFETYWLNPAQHRGFAEKMLREGIEKGEFKFHCNLVLHNRDAKFLAVELAKEEMRPAVLNPSDCIAVMQGLIGYYWEIGRGDRYVGEEDFAATSTGILGRCGITDVYTDLSRLIQIEGDVEVSTWKQHEPMEYNGNVYSIAEVSGWSVESMDLIASTAARFSRMDVLTAEGKRYNSGSFDPTKYIPPDMRLACTFLDALGRSAEPEDKECVVEGAPHVELLTQLPDLDDNTIIHLDHEAVSRYCKKVNCDTHDLTTREICGDDTFSITMAEVKRLEETTRVAIASDLPTQFYSEVCKLSTKKENIAFFSYLRSVSLSSLSSQESWDKVLTVESARNKDSVAEVATLEPQLKDIRTTNKSDDDVLWDLYVAEISVKNSTAQILYFSDRAPHSPLLQTATKWDQLLNSVIDHPRRYGFCSLAHLSQTLSLSLTELCTSVCVSQEGYYFVDGTGSTMNQLAPKTPHPIVFLSSPGLDFCTNSTTRLEMPKYFEEIEGAGEECDLSCRWKGFKEGGEASLQKRVKNLYRVILSSARLQGVRNPSMLPMGLGVFLYNVNKADHDGVREAYFRSQYELLTEEDWGFETYWLNPAQHRGFAEKMLREGIEKGEFKFHCNLVLHNRDAKFLAVELAKEEMRPAVLNPSDCIAVMQGLIGYYWEIGRGDRYVGEEDFAATSTGILGRCGITDVYTDLSRLIQIEGDIQVEPGREVEEHNHDGVGYYMAGGDEGHEGLHGVAKKAAGFQYNNIRNTAGQVWNSSSFMHEKYFDPSKRLVAVFLEALGRCGNRSHVVEGVPDVHLAEKIQSLRRPGGITINAELIDRFSCTEPPHAIDLYGAKEWSISYHELRRLEKTVTICLHADIPKEFYKELVMHTTDREKAEFFSIQRCVALRDLHSKAIWNERVRHETERRASATDALKKLREELKTREETNKGRAPDDILWDLYIEETSVRNSTRTIDYLTTPTLSLTAILDSWKAALTLFSNDPLSYGFRSHEHLSQTLSLSLTELCTSVCVSQEGYYFVDGTGSTMNQLAPKTPHPIVFLSSPGLDFCTNSTTRLEMPKYFEEIEGAGEECDLSCRWKGFKEGGEASLQKRVKNLYRVILSSARLQGVRNPSMLPMGLGVFLYNVNKADHDGVREAYFRSQYELLTEEDWGFETYWLNPAQHRGFAEKMLREGIEKGEFKFHCNLVLHNRDAKFLAVELAKEEMRPAVLNPSDCIAVMQGLIGYYWEIGRGDRYVGEEDFAATSTGILGRCGITDAYTDINRFVAIQGKVIGRKVSEKLAVETDEEEEVVEGLEWGEDLEVISTENVFSAVMYAGEVAKREMNESREEIMEKLNSFFSTQNNTFSWNSTSSSNNKATVMYLACSGGDLELAKILHSKGCPLVSQSDSTCIQKTPLHGAALNGHIQVVFWLVRVGHPLNLLTGIGLSVFDCAARYEGKAKTAEQASMCLKILRATPTQEVGCTATIPQDLDDTQLEKRWSEQLRRKEELTDLHTAVIRGDQHDDVERVLRKAKQGDHTCQQMVDWQDRNGWTALHWAIVTGNDRDLQTLLGATDASMRAKVDVEDTDGWTPLHWAVLLCRENPVKMLLSQNAERTKPFMALIHGQFVGSVWEDAVNPSRYSLKITAEIGKPEIGAWRHCAKTNDTPYPTLMRTFKGTHVFKDGVVSIIQLEMAVPYNCKHENSFSSSVSVSEGANLMWRGVYDSRRGTVLKTCRDGKSTCQHVNEKCTACGCRDVLPGGLRRSSVAVYAQRGKGRSTVLHVACTAADENITMMLVGNPARLRDNRHRKFLTALDRNGDSAYTIALRHMRRDGKQVAGMPLLRKMLGQTLKASPDDWTPPLPECCQICRQALRCSEQLIPAQLLIRSPRAPQIDGIYDRLEHTGANGWPEYTQVKSRGRRHTLNADEQGRWRVVLEGSCTPILVSEPHCGMLPQNVQKWSRNIGKEQPVFEPTAPNFTVEAAGEDGTSIPLEHSSLSWFMTVRARCSDAVAVHIQSIITPKPEPSDIDDLKHSWKHAVLNASVMPGSKGEGDPRYIAQSMSLLRTAFKEFGLSDEDLTKTGEMLSNTALHCSAIFGRTHSIRSLVNEWNAAPQDAHISTAVQWEHLEEATELIRLLRARRDDPHFQPLNRFSNAHLVDGTISYETLPSLKELMFCNEENVVHSSVYLDVVNDLMVVLNRNKVQTWKETPRTQQDTLRYLLGVGAVDFPELLSSPEIRRSLDGFNFGKTPRSPELYLSLCKILSSKEPQHALSTKGCKGLGSSWFPSGFTISDIAFTPEGYVTMEYPLHQILLKSYDLTGAATDPEVEYLNKCRSLSLECVKHINNNADREDYQHLATLIPTGPEGVLLLDVVPKSFVLGYFTMATGMRKTKEVDLVDPDWKLLPIEIAIELNMLDVLEAILEGGVVSPEGVVVCTDINGETVKFRPCKDIWFPCSAEYVGTKVNWNKRERPPLLHRALDKLVRVTTPDHHPSIVASLNSKAVGGIPGEGFTTPFVCCGLQDTLTTASQLSPRQRTARKVVSTLLSCKNKRAKLVKQSFSDHDVDWAVLAPPQEGTNKDPIHLGLYFDRVGLYAMSRARWYTRSVEAAASAVVVALILVTSDLPTMPDNDNTCNVLNENPPSPPTTTVQDHYELGLAKLFQTAPWIGDPCFAPLLSDLIKQHPYSSITRLELQFVQSASPIFIEKRHNWKRSLRHVEGIRYSMEPPGEQTLITDSGLSLQHWLSLLNCGTILSMVTQEMHDPCVIKTKRGDYAPAYLTRSSYCAVHYAAYSGSHECLVLLKQRAGLDGGAQAVDEFVNYQVGCNCHAGNRWQDVQDLQIHHTELLVTTGDSAMMVSSQFSHLLITEELLRSGARTDLTDHEGSDCHDVAVALLYRHSLQAPTEHHKEESAILNRQIETLNASPSIISKLESFASKHTIVSAFWYVLFLIMLTAVVLNSTENNGTQYRDRYWALHSMITTIGNAKVPPPEDALGRLYSYHDTLYDIESLVDVQRWLNATLASVLLLNKPFSRGGECFESGLQGVYSIVGAARLNIIRTGKRVCSYAGPPDCPGFEIDERYCWGDLDNGVNRTSPAYSEWYPSLRYLSQRTGYSYKSGEGEYYDLTNDNTALLNMVTKTEFLDPSVRLVGIFGNYYNPALNIYISTTISIELLPQGLAVPGISVDTFRLQEWAWDANGVTWFILEMLMFCFTIAYLTEEAIDAMGSLQIIGEQLSGVAMQMKKQGILGADGKFEQEEDRLIVSIEGRTAAVVPCRCKACTGTISGGFIQTIQSLTMHFITAFRIVVAELMSHVLSNWNFIDILIAVLLCVAAVLRLQIMYLSRDLPPQQVLSNQTFFNTDILTLARSTSVLHQLYGPVILLAWIKILKLIIIVPKIGPVVGAIIKTMANIKVVLFFLLFIGLLWAFILAFHVGVGAKLEAYNSMWSSFYHTIFIVLGYYPSEESFQKMKETDRVLGPLFLVLLLVFGHLLFLNILIAVVSEVYTKAIEVTNRDWSTEISSMYKYYVCSTFDPSSQQFQQFFFWFRRSGTVACLSISPGNPKIKTPGTHSLPWSTVSPAMQATHRDMQRIESLSISDVDSNMRHELHLLCSQVKELERTLDGKASGLNA